MWQQVLRGYKERLCQRRWGERRWGRWRWLWRDTWAGRKQLRTLEAGLVMLQMKDTWVGWIHQLKDTWAGRKQLKDTFGGPCCKWRTLGRARHISTYFGERRHSRSTSCSLGNCIQYSGCIQAERVPTSSSAVDLSLLTGWFVLSARQVTRNEVLKSFLYFLGHWKVFVDLCILSEIFLSVLITEKCSSIFAFCLKYF